jgi:hypothetical protein
MYELSQCEPWTKAFFCSILWGRWTGNCPLEYLVKFGYRSGRKVDFFLEPHHILMTCKILYLKLEISNSFSTKYGNFGPFLAKKNPSHESQPLFSVSKCQNSATKKKMHCELTKAYLNPKEHKVRSVNVRWCKLNWKDLVKVESYLTSTPRGKLPFMW